MEPEEASGVNQAIAAADFVQTIQRDLNCLSDPDRSTRRRALERLDKRLTLKNADESLPEAMLQIVWNETILKLIVRNLHDPVEKCREAAIGIISGVVNLLPEVEQTASFVIPATAERIGQLPLLEQSEEIRLSLVNLLVQIISRCSEESLYESSDPLCKVISLILLDSFHEIKKAACKLLSVLSARSSSIVVENSEAFLKGLLHNISHAHSRVRFAVLSALNEVVLSGVSGGMMSEYVAPGIKSVAFDHADSVRKLFFQCLARWLGCRAEDVPMDETKDQTLFMPTLLPLLLLGIGDESSEISASALAAVYELGEIYIHWNSPGSLPDQSSCWSRGGTVLPPPFESEPRLGSRLLVQRHLQHILRGCSKELHDWTIITRLGAARLLQTTLVFAEERASKHLDILIPAFCSAVCDDDVRVAQHVVKSAHILGFTTRPELWLDLILDPITSLRSSAAQRANALVVLAALLYGTSSDSVHGNIVVQIFQTLSRADLFLEESSPVRRQLLAVVTNVVAKAGALCNVSSKEILVLLLQLQADPELQASSRSLIESLAQVLGYGSSDELYAHHMRHLVDRASAGYGDWSGSSSQTLLFHVVLRNSGALAGPFLSEIVDVFRSCLRPERDPALRLSLLQLLDELFETVGLESSWSFLAKRAVLEVLVPCGVWQPGKVGAAIRHATMVALGTFLRRGLCCQADVAQLLETEQVLPVVTSCLEEDFYVDTRRVTCHVVEMLVRIAGVALKDEYRAKISAVLLKRLDDSNDDVRLGILRAISIFFETLPPSYADAEVRSCLSSLVLHMDDHNPLIKESVCKAVEVCAGKRPALVSEIVSDVRSKHSSREYCDHLLTLASSSSGSKQDQHQDRDCGGSAAG